MAEYPLRVNFNDQWVKTLEEFLETKEGKKIALTDLNDLVRFIITSYIKEHS